MEGRIEMFVHVVWATWRRLPLISEAMEAELYAAIHRKSLGLDCPVVAAGGMSDHVHLLVKLHPSVPTARLVAEVKGFTSFLVTHALLPGRFFRWQRRYSARTVSPDDVGTVERYVLRQRLHHQALQLVDELEPSEQTAST